jgi:hypothetical protein
MKQFFTLIFAFLVSTGAYAQFCVPIYSIGTTSGDSLASMSLASFTASYPAATTGYSDYTDSATIDLTAGAPYTLSVTNNPTWSITVEAWIDYNDDTVFSINEKIGSIDLTPGATGTMVFVVPANAVNDTLRMRLMGVFPSGQAPLDPCGSFTFGETEDYHVNILPPPPDDVGVSNIAGLSTVCGFSANEPINISVLNLGMNTQDTIPVAYSVNGGVPVIDTLFTSLASGVAAPFTFAQGADFSMAGTYNVLAWTALTGDANANNDTFSLVVLNPVVNVAGGQTYVEDFEAFDPNLGFNGLANSWTATSPNQFAGWSPEFDGIGNTFGTGPIDDHTPGGQIYMFTETTSGATGDTYTLTSPCIDLTNADAPRLSFWYHMFGGQMGSLEAHVITQNGFDSTVAVFTGQQQTAETDPWLESISNLDFMIDSVIQIQFVGIRGIGGSSDMAIDDVNVYNAIPTDAQAIGLVSPDPGPRCFGSSDSLAVAVVNVGSTTIDFTNDPMTVTVDVTGAGTANYSTTINTDSLPIGDTLIVLVSPNASFAAAGTYNLSISNSIAADINTFNDSVNAAVVSTPSIVLPLIEDIETWTVGTPGTFGPGWTSTSPNAAAGWFVEEDGVFNSGSTGPLDDHTPGGSQYLYTETSSGVAGDTYELISPCIDFGALSSPKLTFWYHMYGATMGTLSAIIRTDTGDAVVFSLSGQQQTGENDPWLQTPAIDLTGFVTLGTGQLVFRGTRGTSFTGDMAIDDINLFQPTDFDVQAGPVVSPSDGCGFTNVDTICAQIINFGLDTLDNVIASYSLNGGPYTTPESVPGIILPGDTIVYCFTTTADLSAFGAYDISVVATQLVPIDSVNFNDTSLTQVTHYTAYTGTFPYFQNFDGPGFVPDNVTFSPGAPVITLAEGWLNLQTDGARDWAIRSAPTANAGTGPAGDHTTGSTNYLFVEDSWEDDSVIMISPCFDVSTLAQPKVEFWYHSNNGNAPNFESFLHVDLVEGGTLIQDIIQPIGHKDNNWNKVEIDMSPYGPNWSMRFRGNSNNGSFLHDIAIDDFGIVDVIPQDAGMTDILTPMSGCGLTANEDLTLAVANLGTDSILNGVTINYQISLNGTPGPINSLPSPQDTILVGVVLPVVISNVDFSTPGTYTVTTWTSGLAGDTNGFNDTTSINITHIPVVTSYPYSEDFESGDGGWTVDDVQGSTWELATPANTIINSAASGVNSWVTNADGLYNNDEVSAVVSPCFDFSALTAPVIEFAIWWETEDPWDGAVLQSTIDGGVTWVTIGNFGDPNNWYTSANIFGQPGGQGQGWTGDLAAGSGGWVIAERALDSLGGESDVRLRVAFGSDGSVQREGFAFDDIFIYDTPDTDVGVAQILAPAGIDCSSDSTEVIVSLENFGIQPQTNIPVTINITGAATTTVTGTYTDTLAVGATATFTVGTFNSNVGGTFNLSGYTVLGGDTLSFNDSTFAISVITTSPAAPTALSDSSCLDSTSFMLMANSSGANVTHVWLDSFGSVVHVGDTFNTPVLNQTTTYFVQAGGPPTSGSNITTTFLNDNGSNGNMFDVEALGQDVEIDSFDVNLQTAGQVDMEVYYKAGTYVGAEGDPTQWTLLGTQTVTSAGVGNPTSLKLGGLVIPAGQTYGIYVTAVNGTVGYTNGANTYTNADLEIEAGIGVPYPFAGIFSPRTWNGTIHYSSAGCPSDIVPVNAIFLPDVPVNLGPDGTACEGLILNAFLPQVASYQWSTGDTTQTLTVNATGLYYVDVTDVNGCTGTDSVNLFINPNPVVDLGSDTTACDMITLDAGNPGGSYIWSIPGQFGQTIMINDTGTQTVFVEVTALGCSSSDTVVVTVAEAPAVDLGVDLTGCNPVPLDAGNPGLNFVWSTGETTQTITATPPTMGADTISVTVTDPASGCDATDEIILTAGTPPVVDLGPDGLGCDSVVLDAGPGGSMYMWSTGETTQSIVVNTSGQYTVSVVDQAGCEGVDTVNLTVDLSPVAFFTFNWVNYGFDFEFFDGSSNADSILWEFGDGNTSTDTNPTHTYQFSGGNFEVRQIVFNDCGTDTFVQVVGPTDIEDELFGKAMSIYPNPSNGIFWVEGVDVQADELTIEVLDARGRLVIKHRQEFVINGFKQQIDLTGEAEGVYMVKISDGERTTYKRVVRD